MKLKKIRTKIEGNKLVILFFISFIFIYYFSSPSGNTPYDYFTRLADAFLQGKLYINENPPWLNELIPAGEGKFFVVYPPMPAILLIPFQFLFKGVFPQQWLAHIMGAGIVALSTLLAKIVAPKVKHIEIWAGLFVGLSTVVWFLSATGSVWYLGQISATYFAICALIAVLKNRVLATGIFLGAMYLSRVHTILAFPFFLYVVWKKNKSITHIILLGLGTLPFLLFNFWYNFSRYGVIWDQSYFLIPGLLDEPWHALGIVHPSYIPRHIQVIFAALPRFENKFPYIFPSLMGLAIWLTTPAILLLAKVPIKKREVQVALLSISLVLIPILMHGTTGFAQFGYRFIVELLPLILFLIIISLKKTGLSKFHWWLLGLGVIVNLWGVLWINKLGWVVL